jgi:predicted amidohydrolase
MAGKLKKRDGNTEYSRKAVRKSHFTTSFPVRICVVQYSMKKIATFDDFKSQCEFFVDVAADYNSDFVLFPELLTTQLLSTFKESDSVEAVRKLSKFTPQYIKMFKDLAVQFKVNIIGGSHFVEEAGKIYNIAFLFRRDGSVARQYKVHVTPSERKWWGVSGGHNIGVLNTDCGKVAILICYDSEFPEMARIVAEKGANIIFVPFSTDDRHGYLRVKYCSQARAVENQLYVAIAGLVGNLPHARNMDDIRYAQSGIFTPSDFPFSRDGIAGECAPNIETVVVADVDLEVLKRNRQSGTVLQRQDIRRDIYQTTLVDNGKRKASQRGLQRQNTKKHN